MEDYNIIGNKIREGETPKFYLEGNKVKNLDGTTAYEMYGNRVYGEGGGGDRPPVVFDKYLLGVIENSIAGSTHLEIPDLFDYDFICFTMHALGGSGYVYKGAAANPFLYLIKNEGPENKSLPEQTIVRNIGGELKNVTVRVDYFEDGTVYYNKSFAQNADLYVFGINVL